MADLLSFAFAYPDKIIEVSCPYFKPIAGLRVY